MFPWADLEKVYYTKFHRDKREAGNKPARMVLVASDYQAKLNLSDEEKLKGSRTDREPFKKKEEETFMTSILYFLALFQANYCRGETGWAALFIL